MDFQSIVVYFSVREKSGKKLTTISDKDGNCLMPLDYGGSISILDLTNQARLYQRVHTDKFRAKITSVYKNCATPVIVSYRGDNFRMQFDEERKLYFFSSLESRPLTPEQERSGKSLSYYSAISYYDSDWNVVDKKERFEYDR